MENLGYVLYGFNKYFNSGNMLSDKTNKHSLD